MAELKIFIPDSLDTRFRKAAMNTYGYGRGSLSKAATEALAKWCTEKESNGISEIKTGEGTRGPEDSSMPKPQPETSTKPENERAPIAGGT